MWVLLWPIDEKVKFDQKRLIVASPDQFSWIPHVLAHQNFYCSNCFKNFYYFYYFKNHAPFFLAQVVPQLKNLWSPTTTKSRPLYHNPKTRDSQPQPLAFKHNPKTRNSLPQTPLLALLSWWISWWITPIFLLACMPMSTTTLNPVTLDHNAKRCVTLPHPQQLALYNTWLSYINTTPSPLPQP